MTQGTIIFLNGTSSAGKTTLAHALQERLTEPYQHVALDQFRDGLPDKYRGLNSPEGTTGQRGLNIVPVRPEHGEAYTEVRFGEDGRRLLRGMRRAIATMANENINILIDDIILTPAFLDDYLTVMEGIPLYFVGVRCPPEVIAERESARPGRFPGTAIGHFEICHAHDCYDVEVDTSLESPAICAEKVIARLKSGPPRAFGQLRL
ncbi:MAG: AAA family ATPase [Gammaproteobacteria bacterium]|jgi:chloramphenicol 3-O phosphotransferase|nr:AAA family ATPase [Gammaproteobacteria bacterium]MBT7369321.1 AAA family ATPase [Gammaproteobacteria bacterium]